MSVLVKGVDMPKSCGECRFLSYPFNVPVCSVTREIFTFPLNRSLRQVLQERKSNCPLEEVSESECVVGCDGYCEECPMGEENK